MPPYAMATGDWIFVIDADERLRAETGPALLRAAAAPDRLGYFVVREDLRPEGPPTELAILRLFRNRPDIRYRRPVHEDVMDNLIALGAGVPEDSGVRLEHVGYLPEILQTRDKHARNLKILQRRFKEAPDDLYNAYKLAVTLPSSARSEKRNVFATAHRRIASMPAGTLGELPFLPRFFNAYAALIRNGINMNTETDRQSEILDTLKNTNRYLPLQGVFENSFDFLLGSDLKKLPEGTY